MTRSDRPVVRINLNLTRPDKALNTMRVMSPRHVIKPDGKSVQKFVAWPDVVMLENVKPIINEELRQKLASGALKKKNNNIAMLEGELVSWSGCLMPQAQDDVIDLVRSFQCARDDLCTDVQAFLERAETIAFNPKKAAVFHDAGARCSQISKAFEGAGKLLAVGWSYHVLDGEWRDLKPSDVEENPRASSDYEIENIRFGREVTRELLASFSQP